MHEEHSKGKNTRLVFPSVSTHESKIVTYFELEPQMISFSLKMDAIKFSVKLSNGGVF